METTDLLMDARRVEGKSTGKEEIAASLGHKPLPMVAGSKSLSLRSTWLLSSRRFLITSWGQRKIAGEYIRCPHQQGSQRQQSPH